MQQTCRAISKTAGSRTLRGSSSRAGLSVSRYLEFMDLLHATHRTQTTVMSTGVTYEYLETRPTSLYSQLFVKGTRIRAELIYRAHINTEEPMTPEELAIDYGLPLPAILEAIEYGKSDPPEIAADISMEEEIIAATGQY